MIRTMRTQGWQNSNQQNIVNLPTLPVTTGSTSTNIYAHYALLGASGNGGTFYTKVNEALSGGQAAQQGHILSNFGPTQAAWMGANRTRCRMNRFRANGVLAGPDVFRQWVQNAKDHDFHRTTPINDQGIAYQAATLTGTLTSSGAVARRQNPFLTGSLTPSGIAGRRVGRALAGLLTMAGAMSFSGLTNKLLTGTLTLTGDLGTRFILYTKKFIVNAAVRLGYKRLNGE